MRKIAGALIALSVLKISSIIAQEAPFTINPNTRQIVDKHGRSVIFHGVNVVYKVDPYIPILDKFDSQKSLSPVDI